MTRRVILVDIYWTRDKDPRIPLGHASLLTTLQQRTDVETRQVIVSVNTTQESVAQIAKRILAEVDGRSDSDVDIAIGAYVWAEELLQALLPMIRREFKGRIVMGGPQISYKESGLEAVYPDADIFIRGYGEEALCELVETSGRPKIQGVHYAGEADLSEQAYVDFPRLPSPWLEGAISLKEQRFVRWETQRGCTHRCGFCQHREAGARLPHRSFDVERVLKEVELFCAADVEEIAVLDPIFNTGKYATVILEKFVELGFKGRLSLQCRAEAMSDAFLDLAQQLDVCLEFGLQTIHQAEQTAVRRNNHMPSVERVLDEVRSRNIDHEVSIIFGLPEQTLSSFMETVDWCLKRQIPIIKAFPLMLLRGTPLERDRAQWGFITDDQAMPKVIASDTFGPNEWKIMNRISTALQASEGAHPRGVLTLLTHTKPSSSEENRWQPNPVKKAVRQ